jgi:hypothetical protein
LTGVYLTSLPDEPESFPEDAVPPVSEQDLARSRAEQFARHDMWLSPMSEQSWIVRTLHPVGTESGLIGSLTERDGVFEVTTVAGDGNWNKFESMSDALAHLVRVRAASAAAPEDFLGP